MRQGSRAIALYDQLFERLAARIGSFCNIVGQANSDLHDGRVAERCVQISAATDRAAAPVPGRSVGLRAGSFSSTACERESRRRSIVVSCADIERTGTEAGATDKNPGAAARPPVANV